jgi:hypothetical protein
MLAAIVVVAGMNARTAMSDAADTATGRPVQTSQTGGHADAEIA